MTRHTLLGALSVSFLAMGASQAWADYTLNILHINDWHSRIESNNAYESTCSAEEETENKCFGGAARLSTAIAAERQRLNGQNVVTLNAGDNFQGSLFYTTFRGAAELEFLRGMGFDAMTVGNHEFDDGEETITPFVEGANFPVLGANVKTTPASRLGNRILPSTVLDVGGEKIGVVGIVTTDTMEIASPGPNVSITEDVAALRAEVERLEGQGINKIVALTHVGYGRDRDVIAQVPGVDVIVGGHTHTVLSNTAGEGEGPYPTMATREGASVPVVTAGAYSKYLGSLQVVFDDAGNVKSATGNPILLDSTVKPDEAVLARVREMGAPIEELKSRVVAETTAPIDGSRETCRARECAMGSLIADAILDRTKDQGVTIAIQNGGGIRASIDAGPVTMGEVLTVLPFQNTLATFQLGGADLVASLEKGVSEIQDGQGKFPQVAGLRYALDPSKAPNTGRVSDVEVNENGAWAPIDPAKTYTIATNNYVRGGGDGYDLFAEKAQNAYDYGPSLEQVLADYLAARQPFTPATDGRIREVTAQAAAPAEPAPAPVETPAAEPALPELPSASGEIAGTAPSVETTQAEPAPATPAPAETAQPAPAQDQAARTHVIVRGDTFWDIAQATYGNGALWQRIADANPGLRPRFLPVGASIEIPAAN
ncbi:MAG: multifunctional 2',3'-cyclic-nucleotide 2'-phosphodiesterase/5'-nucleotidase/3'-nucleotidase [Mesorhizobium amorphae]|nr:MAG: multifunctional 2',3'-cyclic-nucleotide 2'-phosphodiesterase/5'-nucleotidase/3'-nucleotidase [Mesorhizobium amorphae]